MTLLPGGAARPAGPRAGSAGARRWRLEGRWLLLAPALFAVYVVWGSTYLAIAVALHSFPPLLLMAVRSLVAGAILYGMARARGAAPAAPLEWARALRVGVLFFAVGHGLLAWGETRVPSGAAAVLIATEPLFIVLVGWLAAGRLPHARGERPGGRVAVALLLGVLGVATLAAPGLRGSLDVAGAAALVVASFSWAVGTFYVGRSGSPLQLAGMQLLSGGVVLFGLSLLAGESARWQAAAFAPAAVLALAHLVVFGSVLTFSAYVWLLRELGADRIASHTYVNPVIAVLLGALLGGEAVGEGMIIAAPMILLAVVLLVRRPRVRRA